MIEEVDEGVDVGIGDARFDAQRPLADGRQRHVGRQVLADLAGETEAVHPGGGQHHGVEVILGELADAGLDIAADVDHPEIRTQMEEHRLAP